MVFAPETVLCALRPTANVFYPLSTCPGGIWEPPARRSSPEELKNPRLTSKNPEMAGGSVVLFVLMGSAGPIEYRISDAIIHGFITQNPNARKNYP